MLTKGCTDKQLDLIMFTCANRDIESNVAACTHAAVTQELKTQHRQTPVPTSLVPHPTEQLKKQAEQHDHASSCKARHTLLSIDGTKDTDMNAINLQPAQWQEPAGLATYKLYQSHNTVASAQQQSQASRALPCSPWP